MAAVGDFQPVRDDTTGDLFLPASRRPDGTWRKPRRVKEGYIPQEEVPVYESKGKQWAKSQPVHPVGMSPALIAAQTAAKAKSSDKPLIPGLPPAAQQTAKKKKKKPAKSETEVKEVTGKLAGFTIQEPNFGSPAATTTTASASKKQPAVENGPSVPSSSSTDPAKRLKNLKKKLKDIEALEAKVKNGELKNPDKDQLEKIKRKKEVVKEIKDLEKLIK
uniref:Partner of Y14 and mago n=1 Tax=Simocephalus serrulatus TaxID=117539 RepID=A0A4Y7NPR7_9CRUS|nr:EOG090X0KVN [Simocephalus serrulatus]SVE94646.1 EOG090X0KVN [Simocephalus serrulatus]